MLCSSHLFAQTNWTLTGNQLYTFNTFVGVGTTTPAANFHVKLDYGGWTVFPGNPDPIFKISYLDPSYTNFEYFNVLTTGLVGIGTDAPIDWLHLTHSDDARGLTIDRISETSANSLLTFAHNGNPWFYIGMSWNKNTDHDFFISRYAATRPDFYMNSSGQIGIGTTIFSNSSVKLQVSSGSLRVENNDIEINQGELIIYGGALTLKGSGGNNNFKITANGYVRARQVVVDLVTIPDYVFSNEYKLMTLADLEKYIEQNRHLPNVPSASEYEAKGEIDITQLQIKMLEKIEELTLYILELKKENQAQSSQILFLQNRLSTLTH
jgi:hypothetical protein